MLRCANIPTGELLLSLRPDTYRRVVDLLAEPREHVTYREIARVCKVVGSTVKAIEVAEAESIIERKAKLLRKVTRVAERAWSTVEDKLDGAKLAQATICAGIATGRMLLLSGQATQSIELDIKPIDIYTDMNTLTAEIVNAVRALRQHRCCPSMRKSLLPQSARRSEARRQTGPLTGSRKTKGDALLRPDDFLMQNAATLCITPALFYPRGMRFCNAVQNSVKSEGSIVSPQL